MESRCGPTWNVRPLLVPPGVVTVTVLAVSPALAASVKVTVTVVSFTTTMLLSESPVPDTATAEVPVRPVPVRVTVNVDPRTCWLGLIAVSVGTGGGVTVKVTLLLVPPGVVIVTFRFAKRLIEALEAMVKVAVTVAAFTTVRLLTVTPLVQRRLIAQDTLMAEAPVRLVPLSVTETLVPRAPEVGAIEASVGAGVATPVNSTAPASTWLSLPRFPFLPLPKKSVFGATAQVAVEFTGPM